MMILFCRLRLTEWIDEIETFELAFVLIAFLIAFFCLVNFMQPHTIATRRIKRMLQKELSIVDHFKIHMNEYRIIQKSIFIKQ